ncbi:putative plasma membrane calcium-transporting ATPase [Acephala macrosclerotiorum]|nr:putative plasma membrane calcium-transporting ATPase [Acephala macrosclerotiorum]
MNNAELIKDGGGAAVKSTRYGPGLAGHDAKTKEKRHKFGFSPEELGKLVTPDKSLAEFCALGGLAGLEKGLRTDRRCGLSSEETVLNDIEVVDGTNHTPIPRDSAIRTSKEEEEEEEAWAPTAIATTRATSTWTALGRPHDGAFADRKRVFHDNTLPTKKPLNIFQLMWMAYNDFVLFFLTAAAAVSLAVGFYQAFGTVHTPSNPPIEWVEGVAILVAIVIIVLVGSISDWEKERQFAKLNKKQQDRTVKVIRSGKSQILPISDVLVGDVVHLEPGDVIPADGIFIDGYNVRCDESSTTGESHLLPKHAAEEVFQATTSQQQEKEMEQGDATTLKMKLDPFIFSGSKVAEGLGTFLVTATGTNSNYGRILMSLKDEPSFTPLQAKLNRLAKAIAWFGFIAAVLLFVVLFIKFLAQLPRNTHSSTQKGQNFLNILIISLTVLVIAVPEGLPLAVTLALAFASNRMLKDNNLVRQLKACEIMGNVTSICSDKTGTLTQNKMKVVTGVVCNSQLFNDSLKVSQTAVDPGVASPQEISAASAAVGVPVGGFIRNGLIDDIKEMLKQSIVANSTAFEGLGENGQQTFIGSQTETALLSFARNHLGIGPLSIERSKMKIVQLVPFDAKRQCMGTIVELDGMHRLYVKGASEVLLRKCTRISQSSTEGGVWDTNLLPDNVEYLNQIISSYASHSLRTISLVYRNFEQWPPPGAKIMEDGEVVFEDIIKDLVFFGLVGIRDPLREGAQEAVQACLKAGATVRMVTGDNILTAKAIAKECGILSSTPSAMAANGDIAMEGSAFRALSTEERDRIIPHLKVLARSSPDDKRILVARLKELGEIVAVTGDGTNDAPALAAADIGLSMGISGTEVAREASSIVLMDDNFSSIVKAIMWGRAVNDAVKKFLQFQITVSITSVMLTFVSAIASSTETSVLTAVQLMWINLFQDTMAALALATDPPTPTILDKKPDPRSAPLITIPMWKMIFGQSAYQLAVTLILHFGGATILNYHTNLELAQLRTVVFNAYVWMNIFNMYNNRRIDNKFNVLEGLFRNYLFITITTIMIGVQVLIIFIGGETFSVTRLTGAQWAISVVLGVLCIPFGFVMRLIPDGFLVRRVRALEGSSEALVSRVRRRESVIV